MEFKVERGNCGNLIKYKNTLMKYSEEVITKETYELVINIDNLDELISLCEGIGEAVILNVNEECKYLEIYDDDEW